MSLSWGIKEIVDGVIVALLVGSFYFFHNLDKTVIELVQWKKDHNKYAHGIEEDEEK